MAITAPRGLAWRWPDNGLGWGHRRGKEELEQARAQLSAGDISNLIAIPGSVTNAAHRAELAAAARQLGGLDAVVNNASFLGPSPQPPLLEYPIEILEKVYQTNVVAPLALIQALRQILRPEACILNITSDAGIEPYAGWGGYGSSKAALTIGDPGTRDCARIIADPGHAHADATGAWI
jgi:NAD(P)-dependent dehydrogenase (short-subunit alcohol dehydrogenase family)